MPNIPLQQRAGRNIGVEVTPPYIQGAAAPQILVATSGSTVLMQGRENVARTPFVRTKLYPALSWIYGVLFNNTAASIDYEVFFVDDENNEMEVSSGTVAANAVGSLTISVVGFWALCPGEKLVLRHAPTPPPPP
jgi:hypothetical protein